MNELRTQNSELRTQNSELRTQNSELRTQNSRLAIAGAARRSSGFRLRMRAKLAPYPAPIRAAGFTLIELSIVLVIIGLLVGGVLVGQDLIRAAEMRQQISDVERVNAAVNTFRLKYNELPGDINNANAFFGGSSQPEQTTNGNRDKKIQGVTAQYNGDGSVSIHSGWHWSDDSNNSNAEWMRFFEHLGLAGLYDVSPYDETDTASNNPGVGYPKLRFKDSADITVSIWGAYAKPGGIVVGWYDGISYVNAGHKIVLGACGADGAPQYLGTGCSVKSETAHQIDTKLDDGAPYTGNVKLSGGANFPYRVPGSGIDGTTFCADYATNSYKITTDPNGTCSIIIDAQF